MGKSLFQRTSSFDQSEKRSPVKRRPMSRGGHPPPTARESVTQGPDRSQLEHWYAVVNAHLDEVGDSELEDVRNEIYSYLH